MAEIEWTEEAKYWLQQIYDYIARGDEEAAWRVILGIYDRVQILREFPESGHRYEKYPNKLYLDASPIFLMPKEAITKTCYRIDELQGFELSERTAQEYFG